MHTCHFCHKVIGDSEENPISQYQFLETLELVDTCMEHRSEFLIPDPRRTSMSQLVEITKRIGELEPEDRTTEKIQEIMKEVKEEDGKG